MDTRDDIDQVRIPAHRRVQVSILEENRMAGGYCPVRIATIWTCSLQLYGYVSHDLVWDLFEYPASSWI